MSRETNEGWLQHRAEWQREIGRFLLAFGEVEWITYNLIVELPTERIFESVSRLRFTSRVDLILQLADQRKMPDETRSELRGLLTQAKGLSQNRNTIAHNPLFWSFFNGEGGIEMRSTILPFDKPERQVTLERLAQLADQAQALSEELHECYGKVSEACSA